MRRIEVVKKDDAVRRLFLDDPKAELIDRKLQGFDPMVQERPERLSRIKAWVDAWEKSLSRRGEMR